MIILVRLILTAACLYVESYIPSYPVIMEVSPDPSTAWSGILFLGFIAFYVVGGSILVFHLADRTGPDLGITLRRFPRR